MPSVGVVDRGWLVHGLQPRDPNVTAIAMNGTYTLSVRRTCNDGTRLPKSPVRLVAGPQIGECLVVVGQNGVMQTSSVQRFVSTTTEVLVETANSVYVLMHVSDEDAEGCPTAAL